MEKYVLNKKQIILFLVSLVASTIAFLIIDVYTVLHYYNDSVS